MKKNKKQLQKTADARVRKMATIASLFTSFLPGTRTRSVRNVRDRDKRSDLEVTRLLVAADEKRERKNAKRLRNFNKCKKGSYKNA